MIERAIQHMKATAQYSVFYGEGRDSYDVRGRTAHEIIFNVKDGNYRCPGTQQGYSGFSTWTRGLAWAMCGFAEQLEWIDTLSEEALAPYGGKSQLKPFLLKPQKPPAISILKILPPTEFPIGTQVLLCFIKWEIILTGHLILSMNLNLSTVLPQPSVHRDC